MGYKILFEVTKDDLSQQVLDHSAAGWTPLGEVSILDPQTLNDLVEMPNFVYFAQGTQKIDDYDDSQMRGAESIESPNQPSDCRSGRF